MSRFLIVCGLVVGLLALAPAALPFTTALESPLSPVYTPLPFRPTPHLHELPTPTERPTPEPWPEATATPPVIDAPLTRLCPVVLPAPVRVLRWVWRAE